MQEQQTVFSFLFDADTSKAQTQIKDLQKQTELWHQVMQTAFKDIVIKGKDVEDVFKSIALNISTKAFSKAISPIESSLGGLLGFDVGGLFNSILGFAKGGVVNGTTSTTGFSSPIGFPVGGGNLGVAGETGPEAILPLSRGPNGQLGVKAQLGASPTININISTPDIESFRRSEGELAASINRIVQRGSRNL